MRDMRTSVTVTVTCDRCQGRSPVTRERVMEGTQDWPLLHQIESLSWDAFCEARQGAAQGFTHIDGKDLCPHCTELVRAVMRAVATDGTETTN